MNPNRAALADFLESSDREPSPIFVGRDNIISDIETQAARRYKGKSVGNTQILYGPPGAGKTALFKELRNRWMRGNSNLSPTPIIVNGEELSAPHRVVLEILKIAEPNSDAFEQMTTENKLGGDVGLAAIAKVGSERKITRVKESAMSMAKEDPIYFLRNRCNMENWTRPICMMVDEAQRIGKYPTDNDKNLNHFLVELNDKEIYPILLVLGGLGDTLRITMELGLSRLAENSIHSLSSLSQQECVEAVHKFIDVHECQDLVDDMDALALNIAKKSWGWPQHLYGYLKGLATVLLEEKPPMAAWDKIESIGEHNKKQYYGHRMYGFTGVSSLVAGIVQCIPPQGMYEDDLIDAIDDHMAQRSRKLQWNNGTELYDSMIAKGLLHKDYISQLVGCPIPSLQSYLDEAFPHAPRPRALVNLNSRKD